MKWPKQARQQGPLFGVQPGNGSDFGVTVATAKPLDADKALSVLLEHREFSNDKPLEAAVDLFSVRGVPRHPLFDGLPLSGQMVRNRKSDAIDSEGFGLGGEAKCGNDNCSEEQTNHKTLLTTISSENSLESHLI